MHARTKIYVNSRQLQFLCYLFVLLANFLVNLWCYGDTRSVEFAFGL